MVQHLSVARVAEGLGVSWNTANDAVLAEGKRVLIDDEHRFDNVAVIGVDELDGPHRGLPLTVTAMESFFSLLQKNVLDTQRWQTRDELCLAIVTWIETKYNRRRWKRRLGKLTPRRV